jgi:hypothetical protein
MLSSSANTSDATHWFIAADALLYVHFLAWLSGLRTLADG